MFAIQPWPHSHSGHSHILIGLSERIAALSVAAENIRLGTDYTDPHGTSLAEKISMRGATLTEPLL
jgi:hypothetical protein